MANQTAPNSDTQSFTTFSNTARIMTPLTSRLNIGTAPLALFKAPRRSRSLPISKPKRLLGHAKSKSQSTCTLSLANVSAYTSVDIDSPANRVPSSSTQMVPPATSCNSPSTQCLLRSTVALFTQGLSRIVTRSKADIPVVGENNGEDGPSEGDNDEEGAQDAASRSPLLSTSFHIDYPDSPPAPIITPPSEIPSRPRKRIRTPSLSSSSSRGKGLRPCKRRKTKQDDSPSAFATPNPRPPTPGTTLTERHRSQALCAPLPPPLFPSQHSGSAGTPEALAIFPSGLSISSRLTYTRPRPPIPPNNVYFLVGMYRTLTLGLEMRKGLDIRKRPRSEAFQAFSSNNEGAQAQSEPLHDDLATHDSTLASHLHHFLVHACSVPEDMLAIPELSFDMDIGVNPDVPEDIGIIHFPSDDIWLEERTNLNLCYSHAVAVLLISGRGRGQPGVGLGGKRGWGMGHGRTGGVRSNLRYELVFGGLC